MEEQKKNSQRKPTPEELMDAIMALRGTKSTRPTPMFRDIKPAPPGRFGGLEEVEEVAAALQAMKGRPLPAADDDSILVLKRRVSDMVDESDREEERNIEEKERKSRQDQTADELVEAILDSFGKPLNAPTPMIEEYIPLPRERFGGSNEEGADNDR